MSGVQPRDPRRERGVDRPPIRRMRRLPARFSGPVYALWSAGWITAFALGHSEIGIPMLFATGALPAVVESSGRRGRQRGPRRQQDEGLTPPPAPEPIPGSVAAPVVAATPERRLAATVVRAETSGERLDPDALALIREIDRLLRPMLAQLHARGGDPAVRHDIEAVATDHLPASLDTYLALPTDYAHEHRGAGGSTPAEEFRAQLTLLVEGCAQLGDALREADVQRQQQLSRFLDAKFRRSDLDL